MKRKEKKGEEGRKRNEGIKMEKREKKMGEEERRKKNCVHFLINS